MGINIKIQKKDLYLLVAVMVFLVGVGYVVAYNSGLAPSVMGHSADEIEGVQTRISGTCAAGNAISVVNADGTVTCQGVVALPSGCTNNQVAKWNGASWVCSNSWTATICTYNGRTYSTNAQCTMTSCDTGTVGTVAICRADGGWNINSQNPPCPANC